MEQQTPYWRTATVPEILAPAMVPAVGGPIADARLSVDRMFEDMKTAMRFAVRNNLPILTMATDRNGAYLIVAPASHIYDVFGEECGLLKRDTEGGVMVEFWLGCADNVRIFWREVKCIPH